jgi:ABC-type amino acid transport/signal transduction systems, periplasmic component/domain
MSNRSWPRIAGLVLGASLMSVIAAGADPLKDESFPTGKLRVAIGISAAGGAFWSNKNETGGYSGVPVDLGKEMAAQLEVPVKCVAYPNSGQITDAASSGAGMSPSCQRTRSARPRWRSARSTRSPTRPTS